MKTAAVVVNWRRPRDTIEALSSLAAMAPPADVVICVENGCLPEQTEAVRKVAPPGTVFVELPRNLGFAGGCNAGMEAAIQSGADWTLVLNNDATVEPDCLRACLEDAISNRGSAVVGPAVVFAEEPDRVWYGGGQVSHWFAFTRHRGLGRPKGELAPSSDVSYVSACCALFSTRAWIESGPFRADYFAYYEDAEWCQRVRAKGWRCRFLSRVLCRHAVSVSSGQRGSIGLSENTAYYLARNPFRFAIESRPLPLALSRLAGLWVVWNTYNAWRLLRTGSAAVVRSYLHGLIDAFMGRMDQRPG